MKNKRGLRLLRTAHLWAGTVILLPLILIVLSGLLLIFDNRMVQLRAPELFANGEDIPLEAQARDMAKIDTLAGDVGWNLVRLPQEDRPFYDVWLMTDERAYFAPGAEVFSDRFFWYERPETIAFEVHAHLVAGEMGELIVGYIGLAAFIMLLTGLMIWWPGRHGFSLARLKPNAGSRRTLLRNHAAIGVVLATPLIFLFGTGVMTAFPDQTKAILSSIAGGDAPQIEDPGVPDFPEERPDWQDILGTIHAAFEADQPVFVFTPAPGQDGAIYVRTRQDGEWHPNGRSEIYVDASTAELIAVRDLNDADAGLRISNAMFPLHATRGGAWWLAPLAFVTGLAGLIMLWASGFAYLKRWRKPKTP
ncbi:MAG: PepSY-associated TM helix domain-containing protein [Pseudomonadota bacterium]